MPRSRQQSAQRPLQCGPRFRRRLLNNTCVQITIFLCLVLCQGLDAFQPHFNRLHGNSGQRRAGSTCLAETSVTSETTRVVGNWEEMKGNFVLRPSVEQGPPRALLHFLGGAIVGAAPHVSYRYLLERLAAEGYRIASQPANTG